jgi:hypothetical protein
MLYARLPTRRRREVLLRRGIGGTLIAAYVVVAAGIPLPAMRQASKSGERYPCESCGCGCDSAERCWQSCCCHTLAQRLNWAEKNGVRPPAFALADARKAGLDAGGQPLSQKVVMVAMSIETKKSTPSCCQTKAACCKSSTNERTCCSSQHEKSQTESTNFVVAWRALGCRGQSLNWLTAVPTLISFTPELSDQLALVAWLGPHSADIAVGVADVPTPPPPERA